MPLDLRGFMGEPDQWTGLYHAADQLEKRKLRADQLALQREGRRAAAGTFLQNYLDPKDLLTGTAYDPMILQGLQTAMQQGSALAASGADSPMLMMALGPMVNKLTTYSTNAKNVNKQIDERIKGMRDSQLTGYNYAALKDEALKNAFYKQDANGQQQLDPDGIDLNQDYVAKAIENNPLAVTTDDVFDEFAKKAEKFKTVSDVTTYTPTGTKFKSKAHLIAANYMVPEVDAAGVTTGFVPKHDVATEQGQPLFHNFDKGGKQVREAVRLLDEKFYDTGLKPAMQDRIRGMVKEHIKEYEDATGHKIDINSPQAKLVGRAIAYDMLNVDSRKGGTIEHVDLKGQPSSPEINLRIQQTNDYLQNVEDKAAAAKRGRVSVTDPNDPDQLKRNFGQAIGDVFTGKENLNTYSRESIKGKLFSLGGKSENVDGLQVIDISPSMPDGVLKAGKASIYDYKRVFYRPEDKTLIVEREGNNASGGKNTSYLKVPEADVGAFIDRIAEANGLNKKGVNALLESINYRNGKFGNTAFDPAKDFEGRANNQPSWNQAGANTITNPFSQQFK